MIELVAFLGNPGIQYKNNRHNAGWLLAERLPFFPALSWRDKFKSSYALLDLSAVQGSGGQGPEKLHLLLPQTFMNLSGEAVAAAAGFFKITAEHILIVHDELELPLGTASLKFSGGLGGHNGLRSMKAGLGSADFWRLRIGIGRPVQGDVHSWVLSDFDAAEIPVLQNVLQETAALFMKLIRGGPEPLLPEWAKKKLPPPELPVCPGSL
jgi:PTH1 family peptidyl-tRNA hydrolase